MSEDMDFIQDQVERFIPITVVGFAAWASFAFMMQDEKFQAIIESDPLLSELVIPAVTAAGAIAIALVTFVWGLIGYLYLVKQDGTTGDER